MSDQLRKLLEESLKMTPEGAKVGEQLLHVETMQEGMEVLLMGLVKQIDMKLAVKILDLFENENVPQGKAVATMAYIMGLSHAELGDNEVKAAPAHMREHLIRGSIEANTSLISAIIKGTSYNTLGLKSTRRPKPEPEVSPRPRA